MSHSRFTLRANASKSRRFYDREVLTKAKSRQRSACLDNQSDLERVQLLGRKLSPLNLGRTFFYIVK